MSELNRRSFLAGSMAALPHAVSIQAAAAPVTVGVIGTGARGSFLLDAILTLPGVIIQALCDIKPDRLDKAASRAARDNPATYSDYRKIIERKDIQAVWIATPCDLHVEMAIGALLAGKHIYLEKPVGITPESIRELLKAAKGRKTVFQTGHVMRSYPYLKTGVARVRDGVAGKIIMIRAWRHSSSAFNPNPNTSSADWYNDVKRSGDLIVENAIHNLDVCNWFAGSRPDLAAGFGGTLMKNEPPGRINTDCYTLSYEYANGVKLSFSQLGFHPSGLPYGGQGFQIYGTEGAVEVVYANAGKTIFYSRTPGRKPEVLSESAESAPQDYHFQVFFDAVRSGKTDVAGGLEVGAIAALTSIMGREAFTRKKIISWSEMGVEI